MNDAAEGFGRIDDVQIRAELDAQFQSIRMDIEHLDYKLFRATKNRRIGSGPFKGTIFASDSHWHDGNLCLKLTGYYEHELHDAIEKAILRKPHSIINVGCCEGYYAIGLAKRLPKAKAVAIDISTDALRHCRQMAELNNVSDRLETWHGDETNCVLKLTQPCLFVIDNEGGEEMLVDDIKPLLAKSDLIIECHHFKDTGVAARIYDKLSPSHTIDVITPQPVTLINSSAEATLLEAIILTEKRLMSCRWLACWAP